jgi:hypothetical protein
MHYVQDGCFPLPSFTTTRFDLPGYRGNHRPHQLIDFVILVQRLGANGWEDVERFDCCHGCCHLHQDGRDGNDPLWQLDDEKDVPEAFVRACDQAETRARIIRNKGKDVKK